LILSFSLKGGEKADTKIYRFFLLIQMSADLILFTKKIQNNRVLQYARYLGKGYTADLHMSLVKILAELKSKF